MITPSDKGYKQTKLVLQGKSTMDSDFKELAEWIDKKYKVKTQNIIYDTVDNGKRPRLEIIFEFEKEKKVFEPHRFAFDKKKQKAIAKQFNSVFIDKESKYLTDNLLVIFSAFEPISMIETNGLISQSSINRLKKEINNPDLWEISRCFADTTFFLYTDEQVQKYENDGFRQKWSKLYFELLKDLDEFDYYKLDNYSITFDSKENFDNNYQGNWFYYYR